MQETKSEAQYVVRGHDRFGEDRSLGITSLQYKAATQDTGGRLFIVEQTIHEKGGPPRHLHRDQEEWFYTVEGEFIVEVDRVSYRLLPGDSLLAPRMVPHTWAYVGDGIGRVVIVFSPAGKMEDFFHAVTKANAMPPEDPGLWRAHGMELVGPPLTIARQ
jgi:quercetin dioxygenase-like cupin family protein